jgi:hypothetical protein
MARVGTATVRLVVEGSPFEYEWAGQFDTHVGRIEQVYADERFARVAVEEGQADEPERNWKLVRRVVGQWEEIG